jgi:UDP-glucose 4-epimerase
VIEIPRGNTAVVVGGCGFIGSRVALGLLEEGVDVTVLDVAPPPDDLLGRCRYVFCDIAVRESLRGVFTGHTSVCLFAALLAKGCRENPFRAWQTNVIGTANILDALATDSPRARVIFSSTGGIYAPQDTYPVPECASKRHHNLYVSSKLAAEGMVHSYTATAGASAVILRFFTVYGPGPASGARGHFIAAWLECVRAAHPLTVHGDGGQTVDLTHVTDVVRACLLASQAPVNGGETQTYNIGSGMETSVGAIARWIQEHSPSTSITLQPDMHDYGPRRQFGDIGRARNDMGYIPRISPREGLMALMRSQFKSRGSSV